MTASVRVVKPSASDARVRTMTGLSNTRHAGYSDVHCARSLDPGASKVVVPGSEAGCWNCDSAWSASRYVSK